MADPKKKPPATVLLNMDRNGFAKVMQQLGEVHEASDDAAIAVANEYKKFKKQGVNLDALRLVRKLKAMGSAVKIQAFLVDFDRMRDLAGFDDQLALFEEDKTAPQKAAATSSGNVVQHPASAKAEKPAKAQKGNKRQPRGAIPASTEVMPESPSSAAPAVPTRIPQAEAPSKARLFAEGDDEVEEISAVEKARADGLAKGAAGENYENPYSTPGEERDAWHAGWVEGSEKFEADEKADAQKSA